MVLQEALVHRVLVASQEYLELTELVALQEQVEHLVQTVFLVQMELQDHQELVVEQVVMDHLVVQGQVEHQV